MNLMNFYGQFFQQFNHQSYEELIKKQDLTLEELLDFDDIVQEFSCSDQRLIGFFTIEKIICLIQYATILPSFEGNVKKAFKYPGIAADLLGEAANIMRNVFQENPSLMKQIFLCVNSTQKINPVIAGYFQRIISKHLQCNTVEFLDFFYQQDASYQKALTNNISNPSIAQIILEIIQMSTAKTSEQDFITQRCNFIDMLFDCILEASDIGQVKAAALTLSNLLINIQNMEQNQILVPQADQLMQVFYQSPKLNQILNQSDQSFTACIEFISIAIQIAITHYQEVNMQQETNFIEQISGIVFTKSEQYLRNHQQRRLNIQNRQTINTLGSQRYTIIQQIQRLSALESAIISEKIVKSKILEVLYQDIILSYEYNSFLQVELYKIAQNVLKKDNLTSKTLMTILPNTVVQLSSIQNLKGISVVLANKIIELQPQEHFNCLNNLPAYQNFILTVLKETNELQQLKSNQQIQQIEQVKSQEQIVVIQEEEVQDDKDDKEQNLQDLMTTEVIKTRSISANKKLMAMDVQNDSLNKGFMDRLPKKEEHEQNQPEELTQQQHTDYAQLFQTSKQEIIQSDAISNQYLGNNYWKFQYEKVDFKLEDL